MKWIEVNTTIAGNAHGDVDGQQQRTHQLRFMKKPDSRKARNICTLTPTATNTSVLIAVLTYFGSENSTA